MPGPYDSLPKEDPKKRITQAPETAPADPNVAVTNSMFDTADMGKAFRNAMRSAGYFVDPWNKDLQRTMSQFSSAALPQYLAGLAGGANYGSYAGDALKNFLTQYIGGIAGGGGIMPWTMAQAQQGIGHLGGLAETARQQLEVNGGDYSKVNLGNPLLNALAQLFSNEDVMSGMTVGAFAPSMGGGLASSLAQHVANAQQYYEDVTRPSQQFKKPGEVGPSWAAILAQQLGLGR